MIIEYKLYCDLDGVLADFAAGLSKILSEDHTEKKYEHDVMYRNRMWQIVDEYQQSGLGELWFDLPVLEGGRLWDHIKIHNPEILSATGRPGYGADSQKRRWVAKYLGPDVVVNLTQTAQDKARFAAPNHILIDDKLKAIGPWEAAGGIGVLHTDVASTIKKLEQFGW